MTKEDATAIYDETASNERGRLYDEIGEADVAQCNRVVAEAAENERGEARAQRDRVTALLDETRADRDRLAAELEAIRGSGGVLTREECEHVAASSVVPLDLPREWVQAGARAQPAEDWTALDAILTEVGQPANHAPDEQDTFAERVKRALHKAWAERKSAGAHARQFEEDVARRAMAKTPGATHSVANSLALWRHGIAWRDLPADDRDCCTRVAAEVLSLVEKNGPKDGPCAQHGKRVAFGSRGEATCEACGRCLHVGKTVDLRTSVETCNDCDWTSGAAPAPAPAHAGEWAVELRDGSYLGPDTETTRASVPAEQAQRFATKVAASAACEGWHHAGAMVVEMGAAPAPAQPSGTVERVHALLGAELATALGVAPESWDALLGRVRGMVDERPVQAECSQCQGFGFVPPDYPCDWCGGAGKAHPETLKTLQHLEQIRVRAQAQAVAQVKAAQPPTLHLTAEDREALGRAVYQLESRPTWPRWETLPADLRAQTIASAVHGFTLGVEAAFAAVQSEEVQNAVEYSDPETMLRGIVTAARAIVRVPAKEEPAPAPPPPLPEVPAEIRRGAADPFDSFNILASYLVALDAALRARGGS